MPIPSFAIQNETCQYAGTIEVPLVMAPYMTGADIQFDRNSPVAIMGGMSKTTNQNMRITGMWLELLTPLAKTTFRAPANFSGGSRNGWIWHNGMIYTAAGSAANPRNYRAFAIPAFFGYDYIGPSVPAAPFQQLRGFTYPAVLDANGGDSFTFNIVAWQRMTYIEPIPGAGPQQVERAACWFYKSLGASNGAGMHNIFPDMALYSPGFARQPNPMRCSNGLQVDSFDGCIPDMKTGMNYIFQANSMRIMKLHGMSFVLFNSGQFNPSRYVKLVFDEPITQATFGSSVGANNWTGGAAGWLCWNSSANPYPRQNQAHGCILIKPDGTQFYIVKFVAKDADAQNALNNTVNWHAKIDFLGNWFFRSNAYANRVFTSGGLTITFKLPKYRMVGYGLPCWNPCFPLPINSGIM